MRKPVPSYADMIDLPDDPVISPAPAEQPVERPSVQSYDHTDKPKDNQVAEQGTPVKAKPRVQIDRAPTKRQGDQTVPSRREAARLRRAEPKPEPADYEQRSLYARAQTFERFRELAFKSRKAQQALYREGLFLVLQKYGAADGLTDKDM